MTKWMVAIDGREYVLQELTELFSSSRLTVTKEVDSYCILSSDFDSLTTADDVRSRATELLTLINAISKLRSGPGIFKPVHIPGAVFRVGEDGTSVEVFNLVGTEATFLWKGSAPSQLCEAKQWTNQAMNDPKVEEVFYHFQEMTTSLSLRKVYELIVDDFNYQTSLVEKHLGIAKEDIERFKKSVEDPRHSGRRAIHPPTEKHTKGPLKHSPMSLGEAQSFIGELVRRWLPYREQHKA